MPSPLPSLEEIAACLRAERNPAHAGQIAKRCGVDKPSFALFVSLLEQLTEEGSIRRVGRNRYALPAKRQGESWVGILSVNPRGFGFVASSGRPDVYVAPHALGPAMHGDGVKVEIISTSSRGTEGRVIAVESRRDPRVAGTLRRTRSSAWLEPDDPRIRGPIVIIEGKEHCTEGDAAVIEITRFPGQTDENPEGRLLQVLGRSGDAEVEVQKILVREQIEETHPPAAMAEAEVLAMKTRKLELSHRTDLRNVPFLTIDPTDARDHDDAVYAERTKDGFRVYVAIADVSEYVQPNSELDKEASKRGCTIYLPDRAIPMLPGILAADACSLLPDCDRYCLCVIAELDANGTAKSSRVVEGVMRAAAMVSYESAARTLGFTEAPPRSPQAEAFKKELKALSILASRLRAARMKRGALNLDLPETKLVIDEETGVPLKVSQRASDPGVKRAYQIVEEMMLLANELVARFMAKQRSPAMYRVHGKPDEEKLEKLGTAAVALDAPFDLEQMTEPLGVSHWLKRIEKHPAKRVLENLLLRSLKQAIYDTTNIGHFGLASDAYLHFTSPIRRYPDLRVHRAVKRLLRGEAPDQSPAAIENLRVAATHSSSRERAAMQVEREVVDLYRALFMRDKLGEMYEGTITALIGSGVVVALEEPFVEVIVRFDSLGPDRYELADNELSYVGVRSQERIGLGDTMVLEVVDVSLARRAVYGRRVVFQTEARPSRSKRGRDGEGRSRPRKDAPKQSGTEPARESSKRKGLVVKGAKSSTQKPAEKKSGNASTSRRSRSKKRR